MKRWIHSATISEQAFEISKAESELAEFDEDKVDAVKQCLQAIRDTIADCSMEGMDKEQINSNVAYVKDKCIREAVLAGLMSEEEFEEIHDLLDAIYLKYCEI